MAMTGIHSNLVTDEHPSKRKTFTPIRCENVSVYVFMFFFTDQLIQMFFLPPRQKLWFARANHKKHGVPPLFDIFGVE